MGWDGVGVGVQRRWGDDRGTGGWGGCWGREGYRGG